MKARHRRIALIAGGLASMALACAFVLNAFRANVMFFVAPGQLAAQNTAQASAEARRFRLGGMVQRGTLAREPDGVTVRFVVTDNVASVPVIFKGALPDLFREGSGIVAQGVLGRDGTFHADEVLAKHDERYVAPPLAPPLAPIVNEANAAPPGAKR